jgi:hypothetical protein
LQLHKKEQIEKITRANSFDGESVLGDLNRTKVTSASNRGSNLLSNSTRINTMENPKPQEYQEIEEVRSNSLEKVEIVINDK